MTISRAPSPGSVTAIPSTSPASAVATNATFSYSENADGLGGRLTASDGIESISIQLVGSYDPADFVGVQDPDHGFIVTYHASSLLI